MRAFFVAALFFALVAVSCGGRPVACSTDADCPQGNTSDSRDCLLAPPPACTNGQSACASACVELESDPTNCGSCGHVCDSGLVCSNGACQPACAVGLTKCGAKCADTTSDPTSCGACGVACPNGQAC